MRSHRWMIVAALALFPGARLASAADRDLDRALHEMTQRDYCDAEPLLEASIARDHENAAAHFELGSTLRELGRYDEAISEYRDALALSKDRTVTSDALYGIGLAQEAKGDRAQAAKAWQAYLDFAGNSPDERGAAAVARERLAAP